MVRLIERDIEKSSKRIRLFHEKDRMGFLGSKVVWKTDEHGHRDVVYEYEKIVPAMFTKLIPVFLERWRDGKQFWIAQRKGVYRFLSFTIADHKLNISTKTDVSWNPHLYDWVCESETGYEWIRNGMLFEGSTCVGSD